MFLIIATIVQDVNCELYRAKVALSETKIIIRHCLSATMWWTQAKSTMIDYSWRNGSYIQLELLAKQKSPWHQRALDML